MRRIGMLIFLGITFMACEEDNPFVDPIISEGNIELSHLQVGQKSMYLRYSTNCDRLNEDFEYTGDSLILEVVEIDNQLYLQESFSMGSPLFASNEPVVYPITSQESRVLIPERWNSALFFFYANDTLHLNPQHDIVLRQTACTLTGNFSPFIGNDIGFVKSFKIGPLRQVDKTVVSCEPLIFNLDGYLLYNEDHLYQTHAVINDAVGANISGWVLKDYSFN